MWLEDLRTAGAQFLVVPATSLWWLDFYDAFRIHLHRFYRQTFYNPCTGALFDLRAGQRAPLR